MDSCISEKAAARFLSISHRTLQVWRRENRGPAFVRLEGKRIGYVINDLKAYVAKQRQPTSDSV